MESKLREIAGLVCRGEVSKEHEAYILTSYSKIIGKPFSKCKCQLCDAIFLILKKLETMETKTCKLKKGIVLTAFGKPYRLTHENITDKLALEHLAVKPDDAKFFDALPAGFGKVKTVIMANDDLADNDQAIVDKGDDMAMPKKTVKRRRK